jgi:HEAT repeat protein/ATP/ADP translocase
VASLTMKRWLARLAPIYPGEGPAVWLSLAVNFLVVTGIMFGRNARDALFLIYFGVQYLPYMYFANAAFLVLCSLAFTTLVDRVDRAKFLGGISLIFVASLIVSRLVLLGHPHWFFPVLYMEAQVIWYFSLMQFWTFVGDLFDTRQAKRLFPFLAVGGLLGMIGVGLGSKPIIKTLGTENLFGLWAMLILAASVLGALTYRRYRSAPEAPQLDPSAPPRWKPSELEKIKEGFAEVAREPLERSMAGYILLMWTVYAVVDFCFNKTMRAKYPNPTDLATFFGVFVGVQGLLCLVVQMFFARPVIGRLGVGRTINFHPICLVLGTAWMSGRYGYASVLSTKLGDATMLYTFSDSSYQLLYNPISPDKRARVRGFIEGYIKPLSLVCAGALVLVGNSYLHTLHWLGAEIPTGQQLAWGALALGIVWLYFALTAQGGYIHALLRNLRADSPALRQAAASALTKLKDPTSLGILARTLETSNPGRLVAALQLLEGLRTDAATETVAALLRHADARVRSTAAGVLGRVAAARYERQLLSLLNDPDDRVRANAVEALGRTHNLTLAEKLRSMSNDPALRVRISTILALRRIQGVEAVRDSLPQLRDLARGDSVSRSTAAYALGHLPLKESTEILRGLLHDSELHTRCLAAKSLGAVGSAEAIPDLIEALGGPHELRHRARHALAKLASRCGEPCAEDLIRATLAAPRPEIRSELAQSLGRLESPQVFTALISLLRDSEWRVRWKALRAFERRARAGPLPEEARSALLEYASGELDQFRESLLCSDALVPRPSAQPEQVLARALADDRVKIEERVFHMLGILYGRDQMLAIFDKLNSGDARLKADALEALDNLAPKKIGSQVLALIEPPPAPADDQPRAPEPFVLELVQHPKPWLRSCTAYYLSSRSVADARRLLETLLTDHDRVVRETALYAGWTAFRDSWRAQIEAAAHSPDPAFRRVAQRIQAEQTGPNGHGGIPMLTVEKVLLLKSAPLFAALDSEELAALAEIALENEFAANEIIFEEGQPAHHLYVLARGKVEVFYRVDSREYPVARLGEMECFGEMAIVDEAPRSASVRALESTLVLKIDRESFHELVLERPQIAFAIFRILSGRLRARNLEAEHVSVFDSARHFT